MANAFFPSWAPSELNAEFLSKGSEKIEVDDLLYWDTANSCVRSVSNFADQGTAAAQQLALAPLFVGVANSACLASDATQRAQRVRVDTIIEFPCDSATFAIGDYVTFSYSTGARNQQVAGCGNAAALAIGRVVKRYASATTKVKCRLMSNWLLGLVNAWRQNPYGLLPVATIAAAGSAQGDAALLTAEFNAVTGADGTKGVILPPAQIGMTIFVQNNVASALKVYPATGGAISGGSTNAAFSQSSSKNAAYRAMSTTAWQALLSA